MESNSEHSSGINFSSKVAFIVGFSALILALNTYQAQAKNILIPLFGFSFSIFNLTAIFLLLLFVSTYLYGVNYVRYDFPQLLNIKSLRYIEIFAHVLYSMAFALPFLVLLIWGLSVMAALIPSVPPQIWARSIDIFALAYAVTVTIAGSFYYMKKQQNVVDELKEESIRLFNQSKLSGPENNIHVRILVIYQAIISELKSILADQIGLDVNSIASFRIASIALDKKIITNNDYALIQDLRGVRNKIAHNIDTVTDSDNLQSLFHHANLLLTKLNRI